MTTTPRLPRYPIYIPSKGRANACLTARFLLADGVPFTLVVEPQEYARYAAVVPETHLLALPWNNNQSVIPARNWIKSQASAAGLARHWQLDDNCRNIYYRWHGKRIPCRAGIALACVEDFVDRYENIALAGLNYDTFVSNTSRFPPYWQNVHVYSCTLILNRLPQVWRGRYNEDTDLCLQVLSAGWCTILVNVFSIKKVRTMLMAGGNTTELYQGDGRLKMARALERLWPGVVTTTRRFQRPQHHVTHQWRHFDTPLKLKPGLRLEDFQPNDYGLHLTQVTPTKSVELQGFVQRHLGDGPLPRSPETGAPA